MKTIRYNIHRSDSFLGKLIQWGSNGKFTHVSIDFEDFRIESQFKYGVVADFKGSSPIIETYTHKITNKRYEIVRQWALEQLGKGYDYTGVLANKSSWFAKPVIGRWYCSELAYVIFSKANGVLSDDISNQKVSPQLFRDILRASNVV